MDQMLQNFGMPMMGHHPGIMGPPQQGQGGGGRHQNRVGHQHQQQMTPFGGAGMNMFENMFGNMNAMMVSVSLRKPVILT